MTYEDEGQTLTKKERRHKDYQEKVERVFREFAENKEAIYAEKLAALKKELREIQDGKHQEFEERVAVLEMERQAAIQKAKMFREYQLECASRLYKAELEHSNNEYLSERQILREKILAAIEEKRKKLREDRENFDVNTDTSLESQKTRKITRANAAKFPDEKKEKRRKTNAVPTLSLQLKDQDISEDLSTLKKLRR
ncbi:Breast cancer metastasis-suppressor 1-like protein, partial [Blyttiomyces sp. JEL0837]